MRRTRLERLTSKSSLDEVCEQQGLDMSERLLIYRGGISFSVARILVQKGDRVHLTSRDDR